MELLFTISSESSRIRSVSRSGDRNIFPTCKMNWFYLTRDENDLLIGFKLRTEKFTVNIIYNRKMCQIKITGYKSREEIRKE